MLSIVKTLEELCDIFAPDFKDMVLEGIIKDERIYHYLFLACSLVCKNYLHKASQRSKNASTMFAFVDDDGGDVTEG